MEIFGELRLQFDDYKKLGFKREKLGGFVEGVEAWGRGKKVLGWVLF